MLFTFSLFYVVPIYETVISTQFLTFHSEIFLYNISIIYLNKK